MKCYHVIKWYHATALSINQLILIFGFCTRWAVEKCTNPLFQVSRKLRNGKNTSAHFFLKHPVDCRYKRHSIYSDFLIESSRFLSTFGHPTSTVMKFPKKMGDSEVCTWYLIELGGGVENGPQMTQIKDDCNGGIGQSSMILYNFEVIFILMLSSVLRSSSFLRGHLHLLGRLNFLVPLNFRGCLHS